MDLPQAVSGQPDEMIRNNAPNSFVGRFGGAVEGRDALPFTGRYSDVSDVESAIGFGCSV